jgi:hypothetical protein
VKQLIDWFICDWVRDLTVPMHLGLNWRALFAPYRFVALLNFQMAPSSTDVSEKPKRHTHKQCGHRFHPLLYTSWLNGVSDRPIRWRCLLRVLCPVRRPVTALGYVILNDRNLALAPRQVPEINSRAYNLVSPRLCHHIQCWLTTWRLILLHISCLEAPKAGSGPTDFCT